MASRKLTDLDSSVAALAGEWLRRCNGKGVAVLVYCTYRSNTEQAQLFAKGRDDLGNRIPGQRIITNAGPGMSYHNHRVAFDAVPWEWYNVPGHIGGFSKKLDWKPFPGGTRHEVRNTEKQFRQDGNLHHLDRHWRVMVEEAEALGIEWAGRWKSFVEYVHFQVTGDKTIAELAVRMKTEEA